MAFISLTKISTEQYGLIEVERLHKYRLPCNALVFNSNQIEFKPVKEIIAETRNSSYIISTFKYNYLIVAPDQLIYANGIWKQPSELEIGDEIWINEARIAITDAITSVTLQHKLAKMYSLSFDEDLPYFANKILVKEGLLIEEDGDNEQ